ncbi:hypothetical protein BDV36DRAFT_242974 [Aspergillus pseudocaelatus]|uniref:Uncharacterized protein n=1 Tax=Aspergillus pseudocaelatus TaxID=1825620 RepID=A0ABQ6X2S2_9EURO|nr:hypothetical protein BDV36DRAFT_242974 [Aspergillus pseudocaelatus]
MLRILSRIARSLGLVVVDITIVKYRRGKLWTLRSTFPLDQETAEIDTVLNADSQSIPVENASSSRGSIEKN